MKKVFVVLAALMLAACSKVPAGNVGVKVFLLGGDKGVDTQELGPGRYWIGWNEELYLFPTFTQNYTWTADPVDENGDGSISDNEKIDESLSFQTVEGMVVNADVGISYTVDPTKVSVLFTKFRKGIDEITDGYIRNMVRDALVTAAGSRPIETVYGAEKAALMADVEKRVREQVEPFGIRVERLYWAGQMRLPKTVIDSINAKIQATQFAAQRANEVAAAKAEADKAIEAARGVAESVLLRAEAEAKAIDLKGKALEENPKVIELTIAENWKGYTPQVVGGGAYPLLQLPTGKQ